MLKSGKFLIAIGLALVVSNSGTSAREVEKIEGFGDPANEPVLHAMNKLERYALGLELAEGLTLEELQEANEQYMSWPEEQRESIVRRLPLMGLFVFLGLIPTKNYNLQVVDGDEEFKALYISRLERSYKEMRPGFLGFQVADARYYRSPKIKKLLNSLKEFNDRAPLTAKLVEDALSEYKHHLRYFYEMVSTLDIYSSVHRREFEIHLNNFNRGSVIALVKAVFPNVRLLNEPNGENRLRELFRQEAAKKKRFVAENEGLNKLGWQGPIDVYP